MEEEKLPEGKLKVTDIIPSFKEEYSKDILNLIQILDGLSENYKSIEDPFALDNLKREYNGYLQRFAFLVSRVKTFKRSNHTYLEEVRKKIKAEAIKRMLDRKISITSAKELVYADEYYSDRMSLIDEISRMFIRTEMAYDSYSQTLQCIIQSISLHRTTMERDMKIT